MMVTVSGMVGTGKSTIAKHAVGVLASSGVNARHVRFRSASLFSAPSTRQGTSNRGSRPARAGGVRWAGFRLRRLSAFVAAGYAFRACAFRIRGDRGSPTDCVVYDRYFYDSFVHFALDTRSEQLYVSLLKRILPVPDVAILLVASPATILERRPDYAPEYVSLAGRGYEQLPSRFPGLIAVCTDPGEPALDRIEALLRAHITSR